MIEVENDNQMGGNIDYLKKVDDKGVVGEQFGLKKFDPT